MEGIEKITAKIAADAQAEVDRLNSENQAQIDSLRAQAQAQADRESADLLAQGKRAAEERLERLKSAAGMERRKLELAAKQEVLGEAFDLALEKLCSLPDQQYIDLLAGLAAEASSTGEEQLIFSPSDRARIGKQVVVAVNEKKHAHLTLSETTREIRGGFIMADGDVEINCAFETLVRLQREKMELTVAKALFG